MLRTSLLYARRRYPTARPFQLWLARTTSTGRPPLASDSNDGGRGAEAARGRFEEIYDEDGRKSIPPERLLRALLLQMLYTVRSERMLMEQLE